MGNLIAKWNNTNEENIIETINYTKNIIPTLDSYADKMEASIFRLPRSNDSADKADCRAKKCYAICPPMDISQETTLAELGTKVSALSTRIQPLAGCSETSSQISRRTQERELYFYNTVTSQHYEAVFSPMEKNGLALESKAADLYKHVANISLVSISNQARDMREDIRESITNNSFEGIDDKITAYNKKLFVFEDSVNGMDALYNNTLNAKYELSALVFELGTEELPPANVEKYEELKAREDALDGSFVDGLTPEQVYSLLENYTIAINDAKGLLQSASINPTSTTVDKFRSFAMKMSAGTTSLIKNSNLIEAESIPQNKTLLLGGFSLVVFLSVASIFFLAFLYMIGIRTIGQLKYPLTAAFAIVIVSAALFSILLFFFMDKTATDATMDEFMSDFSSRHSIALVAKVDTATSDLQKGSVKDCANSLMSAILSNRTLNKTVDFYYIESAGDSCTKNGSPLAVNCTSDIEKHDSVIVLSPSMATEKPSFSTVFTSRAEIKGTSDYFESCPLALTFK
jgi:hypothetical protein